MAAHTWYIRTPDDVYGPVSQDQLLEWARMGRIQPGQEASTDQVTWTPVVDVPFLDMRWSIDIGDGTPRGPFNHAAAQALLASGRLPPGSRLVEVVPPEPADTPTDALPPPPPTPPPPPPPKPEPAPEPPPESTPQPEPPQSAEEVENLKRQIETLQTGAVAYEDRIQALSDEIKRLPPTAQLAADAQTALYALMREEADALSEEMKAESRELEEMRQLYVKRNERLLAWRQQILRHIGTDAEDMTRRAIKAYPEDPRTVHLRQELDALRIIQERTAAESEQKIRSLSNRLRERDAEVARLQRQVGDVGAVIRQLQETRERLKTRERELVEERQRSEAERREAAAAQQALLTRLSALEQGLPGATRQSREARNVRLPPWMGLRQ